MTGDRVQHLTGKLLGVQVELCKALPRATGRTVNMPLGVSAGGPGRECLQ